MFPGYVSKFTISLSKGRSMKANCTFGPQDKSFGLVESVIGINIEKFQTAKIPYRRHF